jgi:hypothetical protein
VKGRASGREAGGQGETPDWIRELFALARRGNLDKLVSCAHCSRKCREEIRGISFRNAFCRLCLSQLTNIGQKMGFLRK